MPKMIQVRHVSDALHRKLKQRAAAEGLSMSEYIKREMTQAVEYRSWDEALALLDQLAPVRSAESSVEAVHAARAERDEELDQRTRPRE